MRTANHYWLNYRSNVLNETDPPAADRMAKPTFFAGFGCALVAVAELCGKPAASLKSPLKSLLAALDKYRRELDDYTHNLPAGTDGNVNRDDPENFCVWANAGPLPGTGTPSCEPMFGESVRIFRFCPNCGRPIKFGEPPHATH